MLKNKLCLLVFSMALMLISCKKECHFKNLPERNCGNGFSMLPSDFRTNGNLENNIAHNQLIIINNDSLYKECFHLHSDSMPFGTIDFTQKSLLSIWIITSTGSKYEAQGYLCKKDNIDEWKYTGEYSLHDKCDASEESIGFCGSLIIDKIPDSADVKFNLVNINP